MAKKEVKYLGRDFSSFREGLIDFAKNYFPDTYNDFNETSPGMMFLEMGAYVGDVLSYYTDYQLRESLLAHAQEKSNLLDIANSLGYKPKATVPAYVELSVYQYLPADDDNNPDMSYALKVQRGMVIESEANSDVKFTTLDEVDFSNTGSEDTTVSVYSLDNDEPNAYLIKTKVRAVSGEEKSETFTISSREKFKKLRLAPTNVISIESVTDADSNKWYEVPYLAQDTIFEQIANTRANDPSNSDNSNVAPYLLKLRRTGLKNGQIM